MNTLFWLEQKEFLLSKLSTDKNQHSVKIDKFIEKIYCHEITSHFYFFIINSFFTPECPYTDIDIVLIPKNEINDSILVILNKFFKEIEEFNRTINNKKIFDVQAWNIDLNTFLTNYNFTKPMAFGELIFDKYSGENVSNKPGIKKLNDFLFVRRSEIFVQKHYERQKEGVIYLPPVSLFEIDDINIKNYKTLFDKYKLFERIIITSNYPKTCSWCERIYTSYHHEIKVIKQSVANCSACRLNGIKSKYYKLFLQVLDSKK